MGRLRIALFLLIACVCSTASLGFGFTCKEAERNALLKLKHSFIDIQNLLGSWVGDDCCSWKGVGCDNLTSHVTKLDLRSNWKWEDAYFSEARQGESYLEAGEVNPALLELKYLRYLDLSGNYFNYSRIPEFLGSMGQLQYLNLSYAQFSGKVPHSLGNLTELVILDLVHDGFLSRGIMETNSLEWAFKLENLQYLDLSGIDLSQALESLHVLHNLPSLSVLKLDDCGLGNSHLVFRNSTISSSHLQHLSLRLNAFSGPIPHFIQNLSSIVFLDLRYNWFNSPIPSWLGNKIDLEYLNLGSNSFNGTFPHVIENLTFLTGLDLSDNQLSSSIPSWLAKKRHLQFLVLYSNHFERVDGGIMNTIGHLCSLIYLELSYNHLQEEVLESHVNFSRCSRYHLESISMAYNNMSGQLPIFESLVSLRVLSLPYNNFGTIPASFGKLLSLEYIDLSYNHLRVVHQGNLANLASLRSLDISSNSIITLEFSPDWQPPFQLEYLYAQHCKLNGPFPKWLLSQEKMLELEWSNAEIFGPLPDNIGNSMQYLTNLRLDNNHINGSIPKSLCELSRLRYLYLQKNGFSGTIPDCWMSSWIFDVELSSNRLSGPIPKSLSKAASLQLLNLSNNSLEGEFSLSLRNCTRLRLLDVSRNNLHGEIPPWSGADLSSLKVLILRENRFKGIIPPQLCSVHTLHSIDLARNNLVGTIPQCFGRFEGMGYNQRLQHPLFAREPPGNLDEWSAVEVIKGAEREYTTLLFLLVNMDLSCNNLVGVIPAEITSLSLLVNLNLSYNHLMGTIPKDIGKMESLESLDLSFNNISGSIPESISSIDSLSRLNLSFNNLQGQIPTGRHLQTLDDPSTYMGNPGLCGDPLPKKCFKDRVAHPPTNIENEEDNNKHEKMWFYLVIMLGFATGFWGVIGILVVKKRWRYAYFLLAEDLADWIYVRVTVGIARAKGGR